jgi:hypothetical protein
MRFFRHFALEMLMDIAFFILTLEVFKRTGAEDAEDPGVKAFKLFSESFYVLLPCALKLNQHLQYSL